VVTGADVSDDIDGFFPPWSHQEVDLEGDPVRVHGFPGSEQRQNHQIMDTFCRGAWMCSFHRSTPSGRRPLGGSYRRCHIGDYFLRFLENCQLSIQNIAKCCVYWLYILHH